MWSNNDASSKSKGMRSEYTSDKYLLITASDKSIYMYQKTAAVCNIFTETRNGMSCQKCGTLSEFNTAPALCESGGDLNQHFYRYTWTTNPSSDSLVSSKWSYSIIMQILNYNFPTTSPFFDYPISTYMDPIFATEDLSVSFTGFGRYSGSKRIYIDL